MQELAELQSRLARLGVETEITQPEEAK